jgi:hypothetical protein
MSDRGPQHRKCWGLLHCGEPAWAYLAWLKLTGPLDRWTAGPLDRWTAGPLDRCLPAARQGPLDKAVIEDNAL